MLFYFIVGDSSLSAVDFKYSLTVLVSNANNGGGLFWFHMLVDHHVYELGSDGVANTRVMPFALIMVLSRLLLFITNYVPLKYSWVIVAKMLFVLL